MRAIPPTPFFKIPTERPIRLKLLKDEIRKPYFLNLKQFLWDAGVQGIDDIPRKVYPSRAFSPSN